MKILHITAKSKGGAGIAALRLHRALCKNGVSSAYLSIDLTVDFDDTIIQDPFFSYRKPSFIKKIVLKLRSILFPSGHQKVTKVIAGLKRQLHYEMISSPFSTHHLNEHPLVKKADIIHLHWVGGILDYASFFRINKKPIIWTLHDMNPFLGLFHYKGDEKTNAPLLTDLDAKIKELKASAIQKIEKGAIISPSEWLLEKALDSHVFDAFSLKECIPNTIDLNIFKPQNKIVLRQKRAIPIDHFVLLFISGTIDCHRKGLDLLLEALSHMGHLPITVITVGKGQIMKTIRSIKIIPLGEVESAAEMATCYAMADVFILPSREDNLPNTMLESFACGTPVISFSNGGMTEHIKEGINGSLAEEMTALSLANTIERFYNNRRDYHWIKIRNYAKRNFGYEDQAEKYINVYKRLLNERDEVTT